MVQLTMMVASALAGERHSMTAWSGYLIAVAGLVLLLWPGANAPPLFGALLMAVAGVAWGMYSLHGRKADRPLLQTAGNFIMTLPMSAAMLLISAMILGGIAMVTMQRPVREAFFRNI